MGIRLFIFGLLAFGASIFYWPSKHKPIPFAKIDLKHESLPKQVAPARATLPISKSPNFVPPSGTRKPGSAKDKDRSQRLLENWDLSGTGLTQEALSPFFLYSQPESIVLYNDDGMRRIYPDRFESGDAQSDQTLFLATKGSIQKTIRERDALLKNYGRSGTPHSEADASSSLPNNSYEIEFLNPGKRDNGDTVKPVAHDLLGTLQGPDYSFASFDPSADDKMLALLQTVLPLGHAGELMLKVSGSGALLDETGFDFSLFQTSFRVSGTNYYWQKFGYVGISDSPAPETFRWLPCDPAQGVLSGCAGAVPTSEGGDHFDLAALGLGQARYIWIKDTGKNKNITSKWPTEGLSLDALRFHHAYPKK